MSISPNQWCYFTLQNETFAILSHHNINKERDWSSPRSEAKASGWLPSAVTKMDVKCWDYFSSSSVLSCTFSVLCTHSKFGHHPHPLGYLCAKFSFFRGVHCWASPWKKSHTQSLTQLIWWPGNWSFRFGRWTKCKKRQRPISE